MATPNPLIRAEQHGPLDQWGEPHDLYDECRAEIQREPVDRCAEDRSDVSATAPRRPIATSAAAMRRRAQASSRGRPTRTSQRRRSASAGARAGIATPRNRIRSGTPTFRWPHRRRPGTRTNFRPNPSACSSGAVAWRPSCSKNNAVSVANPAPPIIIRWVGPHGRRPGRRSGATCRRAGNRSARTGRNRPSARLRPARTSCG